MHIPTSLKYNFGTARSGVCCSERLESGSCILTFDLFVFERYIMSLTWLFGPSRVPSDASNTPQTPTTASAPAEEVSQCPVDHSTRSKWLQGRKAGQDAGAAAGGSSHPFISGNSVSMTGSSSKTKAALSSERETSTIPRFLASSSNSAEASSSSSSDSASSSKWVYPSPSQFFSALQRKDRNPKQEDMDTVVTIHNAVNERTWQEVMKWEREAGEDVQPQLVTFKGRPNDRSPRAWWKVLIGYVQIRSYSASKTD